MKILLIFSELMIPVIIFYVVAMGLVQKKDVYGAFIRGASDGFQTVIKIMPTLIGLMVAVGILRASGFLDMIAKCLTVPASLCRLAPESIPILLVKMFSSSAATGLLLDIFERFGPDSYVGKVVSLAMSSSETIFYTMSVYFMTVKVKKTRYTLTGALIATLVGTVASVILAMFCV